MVALFPKVVVFSKGKPDYTHTGRWFAKYRFNQAVYVLSPEDDVASYRAQTGCEVVVASDATNLPSKRQWAVDRFTSAHRPWLAIMEDNIYRVTRVDDANYHRHYINPTNRRMYHDTEVSPQEMLAIMREDISLAHSIGAVFGGYACNDNHFFRKRKFRTVAFVWTKIAYCHRAGPKWPEWAHEKDDYAHTAACLAYCGRVLVNNFIYPWAHRYEGRGGSRTIEERAADRRTTVEEMIKRWPGLYAPKDKAGSPGGTEVRMRFTTEKQIDEWRKLLQQSGSR